MSRRRANFLRAAAVPAGLAILAIALLAAFWFVFLGEIERERRDQVVSAEREVETKVRALAEHARRMFSSVESEIRQIDRDLSRGRDPELLTIFERNRNLRGISGYAAVFDAAGNVVTSNLGDRDKRGNAADEDWFKRVSAAAPRSLIVGEPTMGRSSGKWSIPVALRREDRDGAFAGAIVMPVSSTYFEDFYTAADVGAYGVVKVASLDGRIYARRPGMPNDIRVRYPDLVAAALAARAPSGTFIAPSAIDGVERIVNYRVLDDYPPLVFVGLAKDEVLAAFASQRRLMVLQGIALSIAGLLLGGVVHHLLGSERRARAKVAESERRLRDALNSMGDGFAVFDAEDRLILWNERYLDLWPFLRSRHGPKGRTYEQILRMAAARGMYADPAAAADTDRWVAAQVAAHRNPVAQPVDVALADGRWIQISERRAARGSIVGVHTDITRLKRQEHALRESEEHLQRSVTELEHSRALLERQADALALLAEEAQEAKQRAEAANVAKSSFLANMSHELRTPLNAIMGFSDVMRREMLGPIGSPRYLEYATDIHASGAHLLALINDVLDMSKIEAGKYVINPEPLDGADVMQGCVRLVRVRAAEADVALAVQADGRLPLFADARALRQILLNLLSNAIKFTPAGGHVALSAGRDGEGITFRVSDTGVGIPAHALSRLGRRFERVHDSMTRNSEGAGLGLALSRALAELHGGHLTVDSEAGCGTTVAVWLPLSPDQAPIEQAA